MKLYTVATAETRYMPVLQESSRINGFDLRVLGLGTEWHGFGGRIKQVYRALYEQGGDDVVMVCDAYDVVVVRNAKIALTKFLTFNSGVLFAAEVNCWPDPLLAMKYPGEGLRYRFLNAGIYMGRVDALVDLFEQIEVPTWPDDSDDQLLLTHAYLDEPARMPLDHHCQVFQCMADCGEDVLEGPYNSWTGSRPCVFHGNGGASLERIMEWGKLRWPQQAS